MLSVDSKDKFQRSFEDRGDAVVCRDIHKTFVVHDYRPTSIRQLFIRAVSRLPIQFRRTHPCLIEFHLNVKRGEAVAIIGANGSGKSTVLRIIAGIYSPSAGTVEVNGKLASVIGLGAGFHPELSGAENVELYGAILGLDTRVISQRMASILEFSGLEEFADVALKQYSSGMQMRLAFAIAASIEPDILLLDEGLAVGDFMFQQKCVSYLKRFRDRGGTLLLVSHDFALLNELCDRAIWLEHGRIRMNGEVAHVIEQYVAVAGT